jgi:hypothetical protein
MEWWGCWDTRRYPYWKLGFLVGKVGGKYIKEERGEIEERKSTAL